jgi:alginate O-acetyltransferase complex protein AlgI
VNAYGWSSWAAAAAVGAVLIALAIAARALDSSPKRVALRCAWATLPIGLSALAWLARAEPTGTRMLVLVAGTFVAMKAIALQVHRAAGGRTLPIGRWLLFTLAWFGMNPRTFLTRRPGAGARARAMRLCIRGLRNLIAGAVLIAPARWAGTVWVIPVLMAGLSLVIHFGVLTLVAALLQALGFRARVLFDAPLRSRSLREFWAQRWNRGFAEMTALCVQRPLATRLGRSRALFVSFLASGLLHEVAISLPVGAGFGLPTCYFVLQGILAQRERTAPGRLATLLRVGLPLPLVFHPWFVAGTLVPLLG